MGDRGAEHAHHGISDELLDGAAKRLDLLPERHVVRRQHRSYVLWIEPLGPRRETDQVDEDHRHHPPLLARWLLMRRELEVGPAAPAILEPNRARRSTALAGVNQPAAAGPAEALSFVVLVPAMRTRLLFRQP